MRFALFLTFFCIGANSQNRAPSPQPPETASVTPEWDVRGNMAALATDIRKLEPLLGQVNAADWVAKGAPRAYVQQAKSAQGTLAHLVVATSALAQEPERLTAALEAFFQMERMELLLGSLRSGVRKYQSPDLGDHLNRAWGTNAVHRDRLRQHIRDLAHVREQEYKIVNQEAQRCRGMITQQAPSVRRSGRTPNRPQPN